MVMLNEFQKGWVFGAITVSVIWLIRILFNMRAWKKFEKECQEDYWNINDQQ